MLKLKVRFTVAFIALSLASLAVSLTAHASYRCLDPGCQPRPWDVFTTFDWVVAGIACVVIAVSITFAWSRQNLIDEERKRSANLDLLHKSASEKVLSLEGKLKKQEGDLKVAQSELAAVRNEIADAKDTLGLLHEMDPALDRKQAEWVQKKKNEAEAQAKLEAEKQQEHQVVTEGSQKIENLLTDMKRIRSWER